MYAHLHFFANAHCLIISIYFTFICPHNLLLFAVHYLLPLEDSNVKNPVPHLPSIYPSFIIPADPGLSFLQDIQH